MSIHTRFAQVARAGALGYAQVIHRYAQTAHNPRRRCAQEYPQSLWITVVHTRSPRGRPLVICLLRAGSPSTSSSAAAVGFDAAARVSAFAPDAFGDLARRCGFADGGGHVRQRDTIPAGLWTRADWVRLLLLPGQISFSWQTPNNRSLRFPTLTGSEFITANIASHARNRQRLANSPETLIIFVIKQWLTSRPNYAQR
jgi:hypothetical protein